MRRRLPLFWMTLAVGCSGAATRKPRSEGERLYLAKCTACHDAYEPQKLTPQKWADAVAQMERLKRVRLDDAERAQILAYLSGTEPKP